MNAEQAEILPFKMEKKLKRGTLTPDARVYAALFLSDLPDVVVLLLFKLFTGSNVQKTKGR